MVEFTQRGSDINAVILVANVQGYQRRVAPSKANIGKHILEQGLLWTILPWLLIGRYGVLEGAQFDFAGKLTNSLKPWIQWFVNSSKVDSSVVWCRVQSRVVWCRVQSRVVWCRVKCTIQSSVVQPSAEPWDDNRPRSSQGSSLQLCQIPLCIKIVYCKATESSLVPDGLLTVQFLENM